MRQWTVDAFASEPFKGNPACVVEPFDAWPDATLMQALAAENNQSETAFLLKTHDPARLGLRWFTPTLEAPLCGHATLASSHVLFTELDLEAPAIIFDTQSGPLTVERTADGYRMDFPANMPQRIATPDGLADVLGASPLEVWSADRLVVVLADEAEVRGLKPHLGRLQEISARVSKGRGNLGVTAPAEPGRSYDLVSRFFAPGSGIPEDPATGGYHCTAAPLFAQKLGRPRLRFHQAYPGRGGDLTCEVRGDRVLIEGRAVTVVESRLRLPSGRWSGARLASSTHQAAE
jgi:PhzF family phenazine biosynthesis protein